MEETLIGVLVDVSGSMRSAYELDRSTDASVERTHAIITTMVDIVKQEVVRHGRRESIFTCAFGLDEGECGNGTCDLVPLFNCPRDGHQALIALALEHRAPQTEWWIRKYLSQLEAQILYIGLRQKPSFIPELIKLIPSQFKTSVVDKAEAVNSFLAMFGVRNYVEEGAIESEPYKLAHKIIDGIWQDLPQPRAVQEVSKMLDSLLKSPSASSTSHDQIRRFFKQIEPFIFGRTPMCKALGEARAVFQNRNIIIKKKVLFILSDGDSTDGDPRPICEELRRSNITIVTCFLTSNAIGNPRQLLYEPDPNWSLNDGRSVLFEMSSTMPNTHTPISYLTDANWILPASGESRLFVQANSLDVVDEFCKIVVSQMTEPCDAIVDILEKVDLATYINQVNADFEPKKQIGGTCYANAIGAVFHMAMHRIHGREGGYPDFYELRERFIGQYGIDGAYTVQVLTKVCPNYRLHFKPVDETGARQAINQRQPVVATFSLYDEEWDWFIHFYANTPGGVLKASDLKGEEDDPGGHAVVLTGCAPNHLTFMNSWGQNWADGGFFRVKDKNVLHNMKFYDVYWTEDDLKPSEHEAFKREGTERGKELLQQFPSVKELSYECPKCNRISKVEEFSGHVLEAECPKCHQKFKPTNKDILQSLYCRAHDL